MLPSFDAYYGPFERGGASTGQALAALPEEIRRAVREEVRRDLADTGGPIEAEGRVPDRQRPPLAEVSQRGRQPTSVVSGCSTSVALGRTSSLHVEGGKGLQSAHPRHLQDAPANAGSPRAP